MSAASLTLMKVGFLLLLYLFLFRAVRAVYLEISPKRNRPMAPVMPHAAGPVPASAGPSAPTQAAPPQPAKAPPPRRRGLSHLRFIAPEEMAGRTVALEGTEIVIGRGGGCTLRVDDTFASQSHVRIFPTDKGWSVEDLGSTNGTYLNERRLDRPAALRKGDRVQLGQTVMEAR